MNSDSHKNNLFPIFGDYVFFEIYVCNITWNRCRISFFFLKEFQFLFVQLKLQNVFAGISCNNIIVFENKTKEKKNKQKNKTPKQNPTSNFSKTMLRHD